MSKRCAADKKHLRQSLARNRRNRVHKTRIRATLKNFEAATDREQRQAALPKAASILDRAAHKNVIHRNKAARLKSRLARKAAAE